MHRLQELVHLHRMGTSCATTARLEESKAKVRRLCLRSQRVDGRRAETTAQGNADLRKQRDVLVKSIAVFVRRTEMRTFELVRAKAANHPVQRMCQLLGIPSVNHV